MIVAAEAKAEWIFELLQNGGIWLKSLKFKSLQQLEYCKDRHNFSKKKLKNPRECSFCNTFIQAGPKVYFCKSKECSGGNMMCGNCHREIQT